MFEFLLHFFEDLFAGVEEIEEIYFFTKGNILLSVIILKIIVIEKSEQIMVI